MYSFDSYAWNTLGLCFYVSAHYPLYFPYELYSKDRYSFNSNRQARIKSKIPRMGFDIVAQAFDYRFWEMKRASYFVERIQ